ncbi:MAG: [FeFe] hydrogenase H-cluster maturation GTPase HydF [Bacillota bacterium]|nr:[FeFe] hydrogenase H-cluster maturation GTPase HydF [Bacillota bacterium]
MSLNETPSAQRVHIGFFGRRNAGKSSLVNAVTGQTLSIVSPVKGTTTDPVQKAMELLPLGPVVIIDTPGIDDEGELGGLRVARSQRMLDKTDVAVLVQDAETGQTPEDQALLRLVQTRNIPHVIVFNKADLLTDRPPIQEEALWVSALTGEGIDELKERIASLGKSKDAPRQLVGDLLNPGDKVLLVTPIDDSAPKGRLILPQQQTIRDILDAGALPMLSRLEELPLALEALLAPPRLVITDSQVFSQVFKLLPQDQPLTSFSILFARFKGNLYKTAEGAKSLDSLREGDTVLISEGCTHHRQCEDIGTVKLPRLIRKHTGKELHFAFTSGGQFPENLSPYALVVHCGGCMLNDKEMNHRISKAAQAGVPITNYGVAIAHMNGILDQALAPFPEMRRLIG